MSVLDTLRKCLDGLRGEEVEENWEERGGGWKGGVGGGGREEWEEVQEDGRRGRGEYIRRGNCKDKTKAAC